MTLANMKILAEKYASAFVEDLKELNVQLPFAFPRASEHVPEQIAYVETLLAKGYAYAASDGVYFDTKKFPKYGILGGSSSAEHSRIGVSSDKHNARDFLLWRFDSVAGWDSPWGKGFPGWHIECTVMASKHLGKSFDIHTGGVDHIAVHHNNEIAQAEAISGRQFVQYWIHTEFLLIDSQKISKSLGNTITLAQLKDRGISPLAYRYWLLTAHYRQQLNFTWEAVEAAQTALKRALRVFTDLKQNSANGNGLISEAYRERFKGALNADLNTPEAIAIMWELIKDDTVLPLQKRATLLDFDRVLAIGLSGSDTERMGKVRVVSEEEIPGDIKSLLERREEARGTQDWAGADSLRKEIESHGFTIEDSPEGPTVRKDDAPREG